MKVVVSGYVGKRITGIGRSLLSLLENSSDENQFVVYTNEDMADNFVLSNSNVTVKTYGVSSQSSIGNLLWTTFVFPFKTLGEKADVSLIPNFSLLLFKFRPTLVIMHDLIEFNVPGKFSRLRMFYRVKIADPLLARKSDRIVTVSNCSKDDLVKFLEVPETKIDVVYDGVDQSRFHRMTEGEAKVVLDGRGWPNDFFLYAGTVDHPGKNSYSVIKAFEKVCDVGYEGSLILAGMPGSGFERIEAEIGQSPWRDRIVLAGYVTDEELIALYSKCRALCFVSLYEGFGMPPLEAMSCGAQVIVSNTSALPEVVGDCGLQVDPLDIDAIAMAMRRVLEGYSVDKARLSMHLAKFDYRSLGRQFDESLARTERMGRAL